MGILDITDGTHPLLRRPFFDEEAPEEKSDKPAQSAESVNGDEPTNEHPEGQADGQPRQDQVIRLEETGHAESDPPSTDNITAAPSVYMDQSAGPTADAASERASN